MDLKSVSVKELAKYLMPLLKRNFLEWRSLKKEIFSESRIKDPCQDDNEIEKIVLSEPVASFYAHWLKVNDNEKNDQELREKIMGYIKGSFVKNPKNESAIAVLFSKCDAIANIQRKTTLKMIESALTLQKLINKKDLSLKKIFENEKVFRIILKSSMAVEEWRLAIAVFLGWSARQELSEKDLPEFYSVSQKVVDKREKKLFS